MEEVLLGHASHSHLPRTPAATPARRLRVVAVALRTRPTSLAVLEFPPAPPPIPEHVLPSLPRTSRGCYGGACACSSPPSPRGSVPHSTSSARSACQTCPAARIFSLSPSRTSYSHGLSSSSHWASPPAPRAPWRVYVTVAAGAPLLPSATGASSSLRRAAPSSPSPLLDEEADRAPFCSSPAREGSGSWSTASRSGMGNGERVLGDGEWRESAWGWGMESPICGMD